MSPAFGFCLLLETVARATTGKGGKSWPVKVKYTSTEVTNMQPGGQKVTWMSLQEWKMQFIFICLFFLISCTAAPGDVMSAVFCIHRNIWKVNSRSEMVRTQNSKSTFFCFCRFAVICKCNNTCCWN